MSLLDDHACDGRGEWNAPVQPTEPMDAQMRAYLHDAAGRLKKHNWPGDNRLGYEISEWLDAHPTSTAYGADKMNTSAEQQARDMLERMGVLFAQSFSAGEVGELANLIADRHRPVQPMEPSK